MEAGRGEPERDRAAVEQSPRRCLRVDVTSGGAVLGAEHDHVGVDADREVAQAGRRRSAQHDVRRHVRLADLLGAGGEQRPRLGLGESLAAALALVRVPDVGELERRARSGEQAPEGERVAIGVRAVIGDDDLRGHGVLSGVTSPGLTPVRGASPRTGDGR